MNKTKMRN